MVGVRSGLMTESRRFADDFDQRRPYHAIQLAGHSNDNLSFPTMNITLKAQWFYGALMVALSLWIVHSFLEPVLAACVTAIASWPLYKRFRDRVSPRIGRGASALIFTSIMSVFVLAPMMFAVGALLTEAYVLLSQIAAADAIGITAPGWLENLPLVGRWIEARWQSELARPGALAVWTQQTDSTVFLRWAQSVGQFTGRHLFIITFTVLLLFCLYQTGESLVGQLRRVLRHRIGDWAEDYVDLGARAVRASVNSMLVVGLFDGFASAIAYIVIGVPHAGLWAAITGLLALVPFVGYVAVAALTLQLAMIGATTSALLALGVGCLILLCGDKVVRPLVARDGTQLRFVWILIGCLGGFEVFGLIGIVIGPVVLTLARELWAQSVRDLPARCSNSPSGNGPQRATTVGHAQSSVSSP
jgi:predicted PurR-regulated permease PerM